MIKLCSSTLLIYIVNINIITWDHILVEGWIATNIHTNTNTGIKSINVGSSSPLFALSDKYLENDLLAVQLPNENKVDVDVDDENKNKENLPRLCVVRYDGTVAPLCQHEDDVETDLFIDPRGYYDDETTTSNNNNNNIWNDITDEMIVGTYGEGWYGQRPVPSLGGGPGYGADAQEIWSIDESVLETLIEDQVELPILDVGIAHGEKARGGSF